MSRRHPLVLNVEEVSPQSERRGAFDRESRRLGSSAGSLALGCSHYELAPGKTAFPYHFHSGTEEALYVLEGTGSLRIGKDRVEVRAGDYVALLPGPDFAHALTNSGEAPLRYLCMSSPTAPVSLDVVGYPDSGKIGIAAGTDPAQGFRGNTWVLKLIREDLPTLDYYEGEPLARK